MSVNSTVKYRRGEIPGVGDMAQQIMDDLGTSFVPRASRNRQPTTQRGATETRTRQPYQMPRSAKPATKTNQAYRQRSSAPDTDQDTEIAPSTRQPYNHVQYRQQRRGLHPLVWIGAGMGILLVLWMIALWVYSAWTLNVSDRWTYGPDHITVMTGVFGHNHDSAGHPTRLQAFMHNGTVEVVELPAGDGSYSRIYIGPQFVGGQGDLSHVVTVLASKDVTGDGKPDLVVTVYGPSFSWDFQRQSLTTFTLINMGDSFKPQQNAGG